MSRLSTNSRLFKLSVAFLAIHSLIFTISPAVRERSWFVVYRWDHWIGFFVWLLLTWIAKRCLNRWYPETDRLVFSIASLLSGWGLLTIWRLDPYFGARQSIWLIVAICAFLFILRSPPNLSYFRHYKYVILVTGLLLTATTLVLGTNPSGSGPRLWVGGSNIYFQPSEPLKLLLILYLAAYFANHIPGEASDTLGRVSMREVISLPLILPTIALTGIALLILFIQRDLGTASIFLLLYTTLIYLATGKRRIVVLSCAALSLAAMVGYFFIDIVHTRINVWLNPWVDPIGSSYQIIQSLLAIANGGVFGRGIGIGSPTLVPVAISDFIFTAITEETGLVGAIGVLILFNMLINTGIRAALCAPDRYQKLLGGGLAAYFGVQSLLILGGNLRLLPLTGVTLPFVSYGGSSLLTSFLAVALLIRISNQPNGYPVPTISPSTFTSLGTFFSAGLLVTAFATGWWSIMRNQDLLNRTDNARRSIADRYVPRGDLLDRNNQVITKTVLQNDEFSRKYIYPSLGPITGYTHPLYGRAGLESTLDGYLRGYQGNPSRLIWGHYLLYGTPPPGLDIRLSIDLDIQRKADELLGNHSGAIILLNAESGEILVMASHPTYNPNNLESIGNKLQFDPESPLINRASQGSYPLGTLLDPLLNARFGSNNIVASAVKISYFDLLGMYSEPEIHLPLGIPSKYGELENLHASPLQVVLAFSSISNNGNRSTPRIALAADTPLQGWVILSANNKYIRTMEPNTAYQIGESLKLPNQPYWFFGAATNDDDERYLTWFVAGTLPNWQGAHLTLVVLLEENNTALADYIGSTLLFPASKP